MNTDPRADSAASQAGREQRQAMLLAAELHVEDSAQRLDARVKNISAHGLMAICDYRFTIGQQVSVHLRGIGAVAATVAWANEQRVGLKFVEAIDPDAARHPIGTRVASRQPPLPPTLIVQNGDARRPGLRVR